MTDFPLTAVIFMILLSLCMFYGQAIYKKQRKEIGKVLSIVCGILIVGIGAYINFFKSDPLEVQEERKSHFKRVQSAVLASELAKKFEGGLGKCLLIHYPVKNSKSQKALNDVIEGLESGFGSIITEIRPVPIQDKLRQSSAEHFNKVLAENSDCEIVVNMVALPYTLKELLKIQIFTLIEKGEDVWEKDPDITYPLLGIESDHIGYLDFLIEENLIGTMTIAHPNPTVGDESIPEDVQAAFDRKYLLITPENIEGIRTKYPQIFPKVR